MPGPSFLVKPIWPGLFMSQRNLARALFSVVVSKSLCPGTRLWPFILVVMAMKSKSSFKNGDPNNVSSTFFKILLGAFLALYNVLFAEKDTECDTNFGDDSECQQPKTEEDKLKKSAELNGAATENKEESRVVGEKRKQKDNPGGKSKKLKNAELNGAEKNEDFAPKNDTGNTKKGEKEKKKRKSDEVETKNDIGNSKKREKEKNKRNGDEVATENKEESRVVGEKRKQKDNPGGKSKKLKNAELNGAEKNGDFAPENDNGNSKKREKEKKKRKRGEVETEYGVKRFEIAEFTTESKEESRVVGKKRKEMDNLEDLIASNEGFDDESKLLRTIFVGNLLLKLSKKEIATAFDKFGEVESVMIRSVPIIDGKIPRKGAVIEKQLNENCDSVQAYIVFKTEASAQASLAHNMAVVGGNHIRVDRACPPLKKAKGENALLYDSKRAVFVGNLPFDVKDEEIYQLFSGIKNLETSVEAVRVVRDPGSSLGKGIAYVLFKTMDAANTIVEKCSLKIRDRELRLSHAKSIDTSSNTAQQQSGSHSAKKFAVASKTPDSGKARANVSYQGLHASKSGGQKKVYARTKSSPSNSKPQRAQVLEKGKTISGCLKGKSPRGC